MKKSAEEKRTKEKKVVTLMIRLYCRKIHGTKAGFCPECERLAKYALERSDKCPFMESKTFCSNCRSHCYKPEMREQMRERLNAEAALSYAQARQQVLFEHLGNDAAVLSSPNDILAIEYLKAIRGIAPEIEALCIPRIGAEHDVRSEGAFRSAMDLRESLERGEQIASAIPTAAWAVFEKELAVGRKRDAARLELALRSRLLCLSPSDFDALPDADDGAGQTIVQADGFHVHCLLAAVVRKLVFLIYKPSINKNRPQSKGQFFGSGCLSNAFGERVGFLSRLRGFLSGGWAFVKAQPIVRAKRAGKTSPAPANQGCIEAQTPCNARRRV